ncbi:MAG: glutamine synthetase III [Oligoflexus sp.]
MSGVSRSQARQTAVTTASSRQIRQFQRPTKSDGTALPISEYFGSHTFGWNLMSQRLPPADVAILREAPPSKRRLTKELADKVAFAVKEWAIAKGATHYCHWFHPQTGTTAEKHDAFFSFNSDGASIERFTGVELMQQEPDASSFPSGGLRTTFEARGYTAWDATSPMFLMSTVNGLTLCIPSIFISYSGESLDEKTPLLRSIATVSEAAQEAMHLLGENSLKFIVSNCGAEQEYFVVDRAFHDLRPDLVQSGRTVLGRVPPKHQQLSDHYFGSIKPRILNFMMECEHELYKLGVPCKTRHNEVAPSQCEAAPIFEFANIAADHNQLVMSVIKTVARRHDLTALFHEKPYANMNGSGKHLNWSLSTNQGKNLLDPGQKPQENIRFLYFLTATIKAVHDWSSLLRSSVASAGNDFRLGAHEAPPAIMSVFLGATLTDILERLGSGEEISTPESEINLDLARIPIIARDNTDRNRTSPFAFTGNKFEFRAVGSNQSISRPLAFLNAAVAQALSEMNESLKAKAGSNNPTEKHIYEVINETYAAVKKVCFEGDGYSEEWHAEAERRGLPNLKNTPEALSALLDPKNRDMLVKRGIFNKEEELEGRYNVLIEQYCMLKLIELETQEDMVSTQIIPAVLQHLQQYTNALQGMEQVLGKVSNTQKQSYESISKLLDSLVTKKNKLSNFLEQAGGVEDQAKLGAMLAEEGASLMAQITADCNELEGLVDDQLWPLPKYRELIYSL